MKIYSLINQFGFVVFNSQTNKAIHNEVNPAGMKYSREYWEKRAKVKTIELAKTYGKVKNVEFVRFAGEEK